MDYKARPSYRSLTPEQKASVDQLVNDLVDIHLEAIRVGKDAVAARALVKLRALKSIVESDLVAYRTAAYNLGNQRHREAQAAAAAARATTTATVNSNAALARRLHQEQLNAARGIGAAPTAANLAAIRAVQDANAASLRDRRGAVRQINVPVVPLVPICLLANPGINVCYMNASMQMLYSIPEFRSTFTDLLTEGDIAASDIQYIDRTHPKEKVIHLAELMRRFVTAMNTYLTADPRPSEPVNMSAVRGTKGKNVYQEIIDEITTGDESRDAPADRPFAYRNQSAADEFIQRLFERLFLSNLLPIRTLAHLFSFLYITEFKCPNGTLIPSRIDVEKSIAVEPGTASSIQAGIDINVTEELQEGDNALAKNIRCGTGSDGTAIAPTHIKRTYRILPSTKYLLFRILRLAMDVASGALIKKTNVITINPRITVNDVEFRVKGAVVHEGGARGGHYVYYPYNEAGQPTVRLSDNDDTPESAQTGSHATFYPINNNAIVVLYERTGADVAEAASTAATVEEAALRERKANYNAYVSRKDEFLARKDAVVVPLQIGVKPLRNEVTKLQIQKQALVRNRKNTTAINALIEERRAVRNAKEREYKRVSQEFDAEQAALNEIGNRILHAIRQQTYSLEGGRRKTHRRRRGTTKKLSKSRVNEL